MATSNEVTVTGSTIMGIEYIPGSFVITEGQTGAPPPTFKQSGGTWTITIGADRKNSSQVAQAFNTKVGGKLHMFAPDGGGSGTPNELNFYFGVTFTVQTDAGPVAVPVYLGQGHYSTTNNWWFGGNTFLSNGRQLLAISNNNVQLILSASGGVHNFDFSPAS